jgi:putative effector of murein hydrolase LrgA (UPF0299 family)
MVPSPNRATFIWASKQYEQVLYPLAYFTGLVALLTVGWWQLAKGPQLLAEVRWLPVIGAAFMQIGAVAAAIGTWRTSVRVASARLLAWRTATLHVCTNLLAKYIPGKIWGLAIRHQMLNATVDDHKQAASALLVEQMAFLISAGFLSLPAVLIAGARLPIGIVGTVALGGVALSVVLPLIHRKFSSGTATGASVRGLPYAIGSSTVQWLCTALCSLFIALALNAHPMDLRTALLVASAAPAAFIVGMAALFVPAGIGVREGAFVLLCGHQIGPAEAFACALLMRVLATARDGLCGLAVPLLRRRIRSTHEA